MGWGLCLVLSCVASTIIRPIATTARLSHSRAVIQCRGRCAHPSLHVE